MRNKTVVKLYISEDLSQRSIDRLRQELGLSSRGRLSDDWDYEFGNREIKRDGVRSAEITLWRADDSPWYIKISHPEEAPLTEGEISAWRQEIFDAVNKAGLTPRQG